MWEGRPLLKLLRAQSEGGGLFSSSHGHSLREEAGYAWHMQAALHSFVTACTMGKQPLSEEEGNSLSSCPNVTGL